MGGLWNFHIFEPFVRKIPGWLIVCTFLLGSLPQRHQFLFFFLRIDLLLNRLLDWLLGQGLISFLWIIFNLNLMFLLFLWSMWLSGCILSCLLGIFKWFVYGFHFISSRWCYLCCQSFGDGSGETGRGCVDLHGL